MAKTIRYEGVLELSEYHGPLTSSSAYVRLRNAEVSFVMEVPPGTRFTSEQRFRVLVEELEGEASAPPARREQSSEIEKVYAAAAAVLRANDAIEAMQKSVAREPGGIEGMLSRPPEVRMVADMLKHAGELETAISALREALPPELRTTPVSQGDA